MAWQDRPYYRDRSDAGWTPLSWLMHGSFPLFTLIGIRVRAHAFMAVYAALVLVFGLGFGFTWQDRVENVVVLFGVVLLHEFGHCLAARWVGGTAEDIVIHPLGGLALARPPRRPLPTFITVAAGPAVNVLICLTCGLLLWSVTGWTPSVNPLRLPPPPHVVFFWFDVTRYAFWVYVVSLQLLFFNLLPIFPLDGGQMAQTAFWPWIGYYRSMLYSCVVGMVAGVLVVMVGIASRDLFFAALGAMGFVYCFQLRRQLIAVGPDEYAEDEQGGIYAAAYEPATPPSTVRRRRKGRLATWSGRRAVAKARRSSAEEQLERDRLDAILAKVSAAGLASLTWRERRVLRRATENRRKRDVELSR